MSFQAKSYNGGSFRHLKFLVLFCVLSLMIIFFSSSFSPNFAHYDLAAKSEAGNAIQSGSESSALYLPVILWTVPAESEPNNSPEEADLIESGLVHWGRFPEATDENDYYYFDITTPASIDIYLTDIPSGHDYDLLLLRDGAPPVMIEFSGNTGNSDEWISRALDEPLQSGRYYIRVFNGGGLTSHEYYHLRLSITLVVADFNTCGPPNNLGGNMGAGCPMLGCPAPNSLTDSYVSTGTGCELRLDYQIQDWSAFWLKLEHLDMTQFERIEFDIKGGGDIVGPGRTMKIEIKRNCQFDGTGSVCDEISIYDVESITSVWQHSRQASLSQFVDTGWPGFDPISDWSDIEELVFTFEAANSGTNGTVYLDNIIFK